MAEKTVLVGARVPARMKKAVRRLAQEQGITESGWVRIHLEEAVATQSRSNPGPRRALRGKDAQIARLQSELRRLSGSVDALRGMPEEEKPRRARGGSRRRRTSRSDA